MEKVSPFPVVSILSDPWLRLSGGRIFMPYVYNDLRVFSALFLTRGCEDVQKTLIQPALQTAGRMTCSNAGFIFKNRLKDAQKRPSRPSALTLQYKLRLHAIRNAQTHINHTHTYIHTHTQKGTQQSGQTKVRVAQTTADNAE